MDTPIDLNNFRVKAAPPTIFYIPNFITKDEEEYLWRQVYSAPKPKWTHLSNRRLQNWGGLPHPKGMVAEDLPKWLETYCEKIAELKVFEDKVPNHVLVNEYEAGQGIMPHVDGSLYYPTVTTISLRSHTLLDFYKPLQSSESGDGTSQIHSTSLEERYMQSLLLEPRSLVIVRDDMYKVYLHGIAECKSDIMTDKVANIDLCETANIGDNLKRTTRVSLTIRYVPKILKAKLMFGKKR
ncbi:hypothetical protein ACJMK2_036568 [Sinanodonta woodiana]|uniref:Fe2OG dioxygenase domain-containing protein n=1 Tax=Sinanodonta woodiana TaxID=1069815 RepID=A0ABD3WJR7_SINWO